MAEKEGSILVMRLLSKATIRRHFNRAAEHYAEAAFLQQEVLTRLLSRLEFMKIDPKMILDCGARTGTSTQLLKQRYSKAKVIACDLSEGLLNDFPHKRWYQRRPLRVCGNYDQLPFANRSFDFIFSNLALHWMNHLEGVLQEFFRILKPNGLLLFSTVGPDTFKELRVSFSVLDNKAHLHDFTDMHDIGDMLIKNRFLDPVMDMEYLQMRYSSVSQFMQDLKKTGCTNARLDRSKGLYGANYWKKILEDYQTRWQLMDGLVPVTVEIIYGHAWMPAQPDLQRLDSQGEVRVPVAVLKRSENRS